MIDFRLPENLRSTDFKVFEALFNMLFSVIKNEVNQITNLKDPYKTPDHMLPTLADFLGAFYESRTIPSVNRDILNNWWWAIKNKGTQLSIEVMAALALKAYDARSNNPDPLSMYNRTIDVLYNSATGEIYLRLSFQAGDTEQTDEQREWILKFIEYVRPAGILVTCIPAKFTTLFLDIEGQLWMALQDITYQVETFSSIQSYTFQEDIDETNCNCYDAEATPTNFFGNFIPDSQIITDRNCLTCPIFEQCISGLGVNEILKFIPSRTACYNAIDGSTFYTHYLADQVTVRGCANCLYNQDCQNITVFSEE